MSIGDTSPAQALDAVEYVLEMCDVFRDPVLQVVTREGSWVPVPTAHPEIHLSGIPVWVGFGTVALWAALDAFAERAELAKSKCPICDRYCIWRRFSGHARDSEGQSLKELEDLRHLYAHNYAGDADAQYFRRPRHILQSSVPKQLSCGAQFDGQRAWIDLMHLRWYACMVQRVLARFSERS
jgi:hypothetical protein